MTFDRMHRRYRPEMLVKVRSKTMLDAHANMPCTLRISGFIPGHSCSPQSTVVGCHTATIGKGTSTKTSDLFAVAGCQHCHDLLDGRDSRQAYLLEKYPLAFMQRVLAALAETQSMLVEAEIITVAGAKLIYP